jgi:hypothetical protein
MKWYDRLLRSTGSTTQFLKDNYEDVSFRVVGQEEHGDTITRTSEFVRGDNIIVHSTVDIPVNRNPKKFVEEIRGETKPIGDIVKENNLHVERKIKKSDGSSKEFLMSGDIEVWITEYYYDM